MSRAKTPSAGAPTGAPAPPDQAARDRATREFKTNLVVTAGAGTGKTAILVERTLNLIGRGEATLGRLALITFTDKAAAELRLRLGSGLDRLRRRAGGDTTSLDIRTDGDRAWAWLTASGVEPAAIGARALAALAELDAASVGTIHQFCLDLLRRHPREARVDPRGAAGEEAAVDRIEEEAWDRFLRGADGPAGRAAAWRAAIGRGGSVAAVRSLGAALARFTLPPAARAPYGAPGLRELLAPVIADLRTRIDDISGRARRMPPKMTALLALATGRLAAISRDGLSPDEARRLEADLAPYLGSFPTPGKKLEGATAEEVEAAAGEALDLLAALAAVDEEAVAALHEAARPLSDAAQRLTLERGFVPFDAMLRLARETLAHHPPVRRSARARFRMLLVDEFQDTDPLQYEVIFLIAGREGDEAAAVTDPWSLDLEAGRLFIVGDPKQSIYRFRRADIAAFRRAVDRVRACGGEELRLSASFRSPSRLLAPINLLFDDWLGPRGDWRDDERPPYVPIEAAAGAEPDGPPRVRIWSADAGPGADTLAGRRAEAAAIAAGIAARLGQPIDDPIGGRPGRGASDGPRLAQASDFALLFRATSNVGIYARALTAAGIPCLVEGGRDFAERAEVGDLLSFLRAVANPNDGPALLAVLRGPLGAVPDTELLDYAGTGAIEALTRGDAPPDGERFPNLRRAIDLLVAFRARHAGDPPDDLVQAALDETPLVLLHAAAHDGSQRLANLRRLAAMARDEAAAGFTLAEILAAIEAAFESKDGPGDGPIADETLDAVRLLTVHKAKGLEFEVVFVPDVGRQEGGGGPRGDRTAVDWLDAAGGSPLPAIRLADGRTNAARILFDRAEERHEQAEERRVFYVACTRARRELILVNSRIDRRAPWRDRLEALGYRVDKETGFPPDGLLASGLVEHRRLPPPAPARTAAAPCDAAPFSAAATAHALRAAEVARAARVPIAWPSGTRDEERLEEEPAGTRRSAGGAGGAGDPGRPIARLAGVAVHRALETWDFRDERALRAAAAAALRAVVTRPEATVGGGAKPLLAALEREVAAILDGLLGSPLPRRLAAATILGRELPVLRRAAGGATWGGACDLVYRDARGIAVADYKTDRVEAESPETRAALVETYADQVAVYVDAVAAAHPGEAVRGELLMLRSGTVIEVPPRKS